MRGRVADHATSHPLEVRVQLLGALLALAGFVAFEVTEDAGVCLALYAGGIAGATAISSLIWCLADPRGIAWRLERMRTMHRYDPALNQLDTWAVRGRSLWLPTAVAAPLMLLSLPLAYRTAPGDNSILLVLVVLVLVVGALSDLLGFLVWGLVLFPVVLLCRAVVGWLTGGRSHANDRYAVGLALMLLGTLTCAISLVVSTPDTSADSTRTASHAQFLALLGLSQEGVVYPVWLWVARVALVVIVGGAILAWRAQRDTSQLKAPKEQMRT